MDCMRRTMNLQMGHIRSKGAHAHAVAKGRGRCRCESRFVVSRRWRTAEDLGEQKSPHVKNDDGVVAPTTRNGTKSVAVQDYWIVAPEDRDKNDCLSMTAYAYESYSSLSAELLVGTRAVKRQMGSRTLGRARQLRAQAVAVGAVVRWAESCL